MRTTTTTKRVVCVLLLLVLSSSSALLRTSAAAAEQQQRHYKFALCPKFVNNSFFDVARDGCVDRAAQLSSSLLDKGGKDDGDGVTVECVYVGHDIHGEFGDLQAQAILEALDNDPLINGLSISVTESDKLQPVYDAARERGIPMVTFDSDDPESGRAAYIGTDNNFLGSQIAKVLQKLAPGGGKYAILTSEAPNLDDRTDGIQNVLSNDPAWVPYGQGTDGIVSYEGNNTLGIIRMKETLEAHPDLDAFLMVNAVAMGYEEWGDFVVGQPNTLFISADDGEWQLRYLKVNKVHGLVGQSVYEMGVKTVDTLFELARNPFYHNVPDFVGTNVVEHLVVPLVLPELTVQNNQLPVWAVVIGIVLFVTVTVTAVLFSLWTLLNRNIHVIRMAQPEFLLMIAFGCIVLAGTIVPMSLENFNTVGSSAICMTSPWLLCMGFTIVFAALFAKTWRINHVVRASRSFLRTSFTTSDAAKPFCALLLANAVVLTVWTVVDPLLYTRKDAPGTDEWNRVIETYGTCESNDSSTPYVVTLAILNVGVLLLAIYQAYRARTLHSDFSESTYIAIAMLSLLQACIIGGPVILLVQDNPLASYLTWVFMLFFVCTAVVCLIFIPKMQAAMEQQQQQQHQDPASSSTGKSTETKWNGRSIQVGGSATGRHRRSGDQFASSEYNWQNWMVKPSDDNNSNQQPSSDLSNGGGGDGGCGGDGGGDPKSVDANESSLGSRSFTTSGPKTPVVAPTQEASTSNKVVKDDETGFVEDEEGNTINNNNNNNNNNSRDVTASSPSPIES